MVTHAHNPSYAVWRERRIMAQSQPQNQPYLKNKIKAKRAGGMVQVVEHFA
jgi:hypothetical protein